MERGCGITLEDGLHHTRFSQQVSEHRNELLGVKKEDRGYQVTEVLYQEVGPEKFQKENNMDN